MARSRTSGANLFVVLLIQAPPSQELKPPANPERFTYKRGEWEEYQNHVSQWERDRYLKFF